MSEPQGSASDLDLIRRAKLGETAAYDELMTRYSQSIYRLCYSLCRNHADAEDLSQDTFIRAYRAIGRYDEQYRFYTWLHKIAVNLCINRFNRQRRERTVQLAEDEDSAGWQDVPDQRPSPGDEDLRRDLDQAILKLPEEQRAVFVLRVKEELSYNQISKMLRIPVGTVMSRLNRARGRLKELLKDYLPA